MLKLKLNTSGSSKVRDGSPSSTGIVGEANTPAIKTPRIRLKSTSSALNINDGTNSPNRDAPIKSGNNIDGTKKAKVRFKPSSRGVGYDSEAEDKEIDPILEEQIVLRFASTLLKEAKYLHSAIEAKSITEKDVWIKFKDDRNAVVFINDSLLAAVLLDAPCIVECNKTYDKKTLYKTADISQFLYVTHQIEEEGDLVINPGRKVYETNDGLSRILKNVRKNRFRKRVSNRTIETVESEVDRLLKLDAQADKVTYQIVDRNSLENEEINSDENDDDEDDEDDDDEDEDDNNSDDFDRNESEVRSIANDPMDLDDDENLDALLAGQLEMDLAEEHATESRKDGSSSKRAKKSRNEYEGIFEEDEEDEEIDEDEDERIALSRKREEDEEEEEEDDEDDEAAVGDDEDEDVREAAQQSRARRDRIRDLKASIASNLESAKKAANPIMKSRFMDTVKKLQAELDVKEDEEADNL